MVSLAPLAPDFIDAKNAVLADNWWALALRGVFAVLFSVFAFAEPGATMLGLVLVFGAYSFVDGLCNVVVAVRGARRHERWGLLLLNGVFGIMIGIGSVLWPGISVLAFVFIVAAWAIVSAGLTLGAAASLKITHGRWLLVFGGIVSLIYGVLLVASPLIGALVLTWWVGAHALVFGVSLVALAFRLRKYRGGHMSGAVSAST